LENRISYWLLPCEDERSYFQNLIDQLAEKYGARSFTPHLTLYVAPDTPQDDPGEIMEKAIQGVDPLSLEIDQTQISDEITMTLYISFYPHETLTKMHHKLKLNSTIASDYRLDPHMSLIYYPLKNREKELIATSLQVNRSWVAFDEVWAVSTPDVTNDRVEVDRWEVVCKSRLS
jgi:hypothetical protein